MILAELVLLGEVKKPVNGAGLALFERGVSFFPAVGDRVFLASTEDLSIVYARPNSPSIRIGTIVQNTSIPAYIAPDNLLSKHFAILGTTGTGKSCATALILHRILEAHANAHVLLIDPHNEYAKAFEDLAETIDSSSLQLPFWMFSFEEFAATILGRDSHCDAAAMEASLLGDLVMRAKKAFPGNSERARQITRETPVPYRISDLMEMLEDEMGRLDKPDHIAPYMRIKSRINTLRSDSRYEFIFGGISIYDNLNKVLSRLFRIPVAGKPITILDLSSVPSEILNIIVSVISRIAFDFALFAEAQIPILLICEEAHRYIPDDPRRGFEPTKRIISRIAKEGRKYGLSLCIVSQRPSELSITALSQCNTVFALRLSSQEDQSFVHSALPGWGDGLLDLLPSLRNGEAVVLGEAISVPARVQFDTLAPEHLPRNASVSFSTKWESDCKDGSLLNAVIDKWRNER